MKNFPIFFLLSISVACFQSCSEKNETETLENLGIPKTIQVFASSPKDSSNLKSASIVERINDGDTIVRPRNVNILFSSTDEFGNPYAGLWAGHQVQSDLPKGTLLSYNFNDWGDQTMMNFPDYGIFKVVLCDPNSYEAIMTFYVLVEGIPGKVGDDWRGSYIFRMEKKYSREFGLLKEYTFIYFKYKENIKAEEAYMFLDLYKNGVIVHANRPVKLIRWPFSKENYYYLCITDTSSLGINDSFMYTDFDYFKAQFVRGTFENGRLVGGQSDDNNKLSRLYEVQSAKIPFTW